MTKANVTSTKINELHHKRWLFALLVLVVFMLSGCNKDEETLGNSIPADDAIYVEAVKTRDISLVEDHTTYKGIQYDIILTTGMSESLLNQIGVGLQFKGETQQFWGKSESGYSNSFSILGRTNSQLKILVSIELVKDTATDEEINKFKSEETLSDLAVKLFYQGEPYTTLQLSQ